MSILNNNPNSPFHIAKLTDDVKNWCTHLDGKFGEYVYTVSTATHFNKSGENSQFYVSGEFNLVPKEKFEVVGHAGFTGFGLVFLDLKQEDLNKNNLES